MFWYFPRFWYSLLHCFCWVFWIWQKTLIITNHTFFLWNCKIFPHFVVFLIYFSRNMMSNFSRWRNLQRPEKLSSKIFIRSYPLFFEYWWFLSDIISMPRVYVIGCSLSLVLTAPIRMYLCFASDAIDLKCQLNQTDFKS